MSCFRRIYYYPFGMEMEGPWELSTSEPTNAYLYNGKEMNKDFGLNWNDHGWRWYDPAIGRWNSVDPLAEIAPELTPYRFGFNNPILFADLNGLFETKNAAKEYAKNNGIKTGWFRSNKIRKQSDGTYAIENKKGGTSTQQVTDDAGNDLGVMTGAMVSANDVVGTVYDEPNQGYLDRFLFGTNFNKTEIRRDGSTHRVTTERFEPPPLPVGPGSVRGVKTFADIVKGLKGKNIKHGVKYLKEGKDEVAKIYKSLRENGFKLISRKGNSRVLENAKTGEKIIFRKSKSGDYNYFDSITQPTGGGKNSTVFFE